VGIAWQRQISVGEEISEDNAEQSSRRKACVHAAKKAHGVGNEVDCMRNMDHIVAAADICMLKLPDARANSEFRVQRRRRRVGIDTLRVPAVRRKDADGLAKPAADIDEPPSRSPRERREKAIGADSTGTTDAATVGPGTLFLSVDKSASARFAAHSRAKTSVHGWCEG